MYGEIGRCRDSHWRRICSSPQPCEKRIAQVDAKAMLSGAYSVAIGTGLRWSASENCAHPPCAPLMPPIAPLPKSPAVPAVSS